MNNEKSFYMVFLENGRNPTYKHENLDKATEEAKRLLKQGYSKKAFILKALHNIEIETNFKQNSLNDPDIFVLKKDDESPF